MSRYRLMESIQAWAISAFPLYLSGVPMWISVILKLVVGGAAGAAGWFDMIFTTGDKVLLWQKRTRGKAIPFVKDARTRLNFPWVYLDGRYSHTVETDVLPSRSQEKGMTKRHWQLGFCTGGLGQHKSFRSPCAHKVTLRGKEWGNNDWQARSQQGNEYGYA